MIRIAIAQINPTVGDLVGNLAMLREQARLAHQRNADMVVFPELALSGYYPGDILEEPLFLEQLGATHEELRLATRETPGLLWVLGAPKRRYGAGKRLANALLAIRDGEVVLEYAKQLLPTYGIFDERRHFEPGPDVAKVLRVGGVRIAFLVCEDAWNDRLDQYGVNPWDRIQGAAPDLVVSINASPSHLGKREERHELFRLASHRHDLRILYVNQVGGHDQVVYDGASFAMDPSKGLVDEAALFETELRTIGFGAEGFLDAEDRPLGPIEAAPLADSEFHRRQIVLGLRDYARRCGFTRALVGSSGGIDSALTLALAAEAFGPGNVVGITMPSSFSSAGSVEDSVRLCENLGIQLLVHPIRDLVENCRKGFEEGFGEPLRGLALENVQARLRGTILMEYSNQFGHLLLTTGNKSEISVGYCTLYGDTNGGLGVIGDLYKTEVFALCRHLNEVASREIIPNSILEKEPSAELAPGQADRDSLPPYPVLDAILKDIIEGDLLRPFEKSEVRRRIQILQASQDGHALISRVRQMMSRSEYKRRQAPPLLRLRARAFGQGRQMPIAAIQIQGPQHRGNHDRI